MALPGHAGFNTNQYIRFAGVCKNKSENRTKILILYKYANFCVLELYRESESCQKQCNGNDDTGKHDMTINQLRDKREHAEDAQDHTTVRLVSLIIWRKLHGINRAATIAQGMAQ